MTDTALAQTDLAASFHHCRRLTQRTAGNFYYSFLTLPSEVRRDMCALYAFMRVSDDLGDDDSVPLEQRRTNLATWRESVAQTLSSGHSNHAVLPALVDVVERRAIPRELLSDVIDGIEMDLAPVAFETFAQLERYCYHVAGAVGLCCIHVWGFEGRAARQQAIECGLAFQLTNILRDLAEDAARGRTYLPREDLDRFGYTPADLAASVNDERFVRLMAFEVERAKASYERSKPLSTSINPVGRPVLAAMRRIYGGLLQEIERRNYDVFTRRVALPRWKKLAIAATARWTRVGEQSNDQEDLLR